MIIRTEKIFWRKKGFFTIEKVKVEKWFFLFIPIYIRKTILDEKKQ